MLGMLILGICYLGDTNLGDLFFGGSNFRRGDRESIDECRRIARKFLGDKVNSHEVYETKTGGKKKYPRHDIRHDTPHDTS
jgi:hypothetical protein